MSSNNDNIIDKVNTNIIIILICSLDEESG